MRRSRVSSLVLCVIVGNVMVTPQAFAQTKVHTHNRSTGTADKFRSVYSDLQSVSLSFSSSMGSGSLKAVRGKGFRITMPGSTFISNGITIWQVQEATKTVVINSAQDASDELSIERIFFALLHVYTPEVAKNSPEQMVINLTPPNADVRIAGVDRATVYATASLDITRIEVTSGATTTTWSISKLIRNAKVSASDLTYKIQKGWTVVDLR